MTLRELEKSLCLLEDLEDIRKPQRHYMYWLDSEEYDKVVDCYAEDEKPRSGITPRASVKKKSRTYIKPMVKS